MFAIGQICINVKGEGGGGLDQWSRDWTRSYPINRLKPVRVNSVLIDLLFVNIQRLFKYFFFGKILYKYSFNSTVLLYHHQSKHAFMQVQPICFTHFWANVCYSKNGFTFCIVFPFKLIKNSAAPRTCSYAEWEMSRSTSCHVVRNKNQIREAKADLKWQFLVFYYIFKS